MTMCRDLHADRKGKVFRIVPTATPFHSGIRIGPYHFVLADCLKPCLFSVSLTQILIRLKLKVSEIFQKMKEKIR